MAGPSFDPAAIAERIWREAGYRPVFPRDLLRPIMETYDLAVVLIPRLSVAAINQWLREHDRAPLDGLADRHLSGGLLAQRGHGIAFIDGALVVEERRFAIAHEFAHFFLHYLEPRRKAIARFGEAILAVLDGDRLPTVEERLSGILRNIPLGPYRNYLNRDAFGRPDASTGAAEDDADYLALELLAPRAEVLARSGPDPQACRIEKDFGVPRSLAVLWAEFLSRQQPRQDPLIHRLERAVKKNV